MDTGLATHSDIDKWIHRWVGSVLNVSGRVRIGWMTAGGIGSAPFRILLPAFLRYRPRVRERAFPIPLTALFITGRRVKIASHDVNGRVV